jgi:hypothetical protein
MSIRGQSRNLTEKRVGGLSWKTARTSVQDSSVWVHVQQLNLKLHEYFP